MTYSWEQSGLSTRLPRLNYGTKLTIMHFNNQKAGKWFDAHPQDHSRLSTLLVEAAYLHPWQGSLLWPLFFCYAHISLSFKMTTTFCICKSSLLITNGSYRGTLPQALCITLTLKRNYSPGSHITDICSKQLLEFLSGPQNGCTFERSSCICAPIDHASRASWSGTDEVTIIHVQ